MNMGILLDEFLMDRTQQFQALDDWRKRLIISIAASYELFYFLVKTMDQVSKATFQIWRYGWLVFPQQKNGWNPTMGSFYLHKNS